MLTVFDGATGYPIFDDKYYVRLLASGLDEIIFNVSIRDPVYKYLVEEAQIRDRDGNYYLVKQIDAGSESAKIVAQIDIDAFKSSMFQKYTNGSATVYSTVLQVLPSGWSIIDYAAKSFKRTIPTSDTTSDYNVTAWDVLQACCTTYSVRFRFDNVKKIVYIIDPDTYINIGAFATRDLNLKELNFKGKSTGFVTRLYAEGADGLTFASINSGKAYVDNNEYSNKVISYYWKDERYTDAQSLLDDATEKLAELAKPTRSYDCDVLDLANTNPEKYGFEDFSLFNVITLIDDAQERRLDYQIVEKWEYPYYPVNNKVVLSTETPKIQNQVVSLIDSVNNPTSTFQQIMQSAIANSTALITGNKGGYVVFHDSDGDGKPDEILIMNTPTIETATKVWRWNSGGLGYSKNGYNGNYGLAMTIDGAIVADFITTGSLTANIIKAGILTDLKGKFSLDMENGTLTMQDGTFSGTINASTVNGGTITGSTIQNATSGSRVLMDSSSSLKGYYGDVLHNIINMSNRNDENNDLIIDADHQLHIRTPKVYVTNTSAGTGETTVYETYNNYSDGYEFVSNVSKNQRPEYWLHTYAPEDEDADILTMLPVSLNVEKTNFKIRHGMLLSGATTSSSDI